MNKENEKLLAMQLSILRDFLIHYASFRELHKHFDELIESGTQEFWVYTINSHYLQAINLWCMVFGSNNSNETHWKNLGLEHDFKPVILNKFQMESSQYEKYWSKVTSWRNKYSAHRQPGFLTETPDLKLARNIVLLYIGWVLKHMEVGNSLSFELVEENYVNELTETINRITECNI